MYKKIYKKCVKPASKIMGRTSIFRVYPACGERAPGPGPVPDHGAWAGPCGLWPLLFSSLPARMAVFGAAGAGSKMSWIQWRGANPGEAFGLRGVGNLRTVDFGLGASRDDRAEAFDGASGGPGDERGERHEVMVLAITMRLDPGRGPAPSCRRIRHRASGREDQWGLGSV